MKTNQELRSRYQFTIFLLGLNILLSLVQGAVEALAGYRFYLFSPFFEPWLILLTVVATLLQLLLLWYFWRNNYILIAITFGLTFIGNLAYTGLIFLALFNSELQQFMPTAIVILIGLGALFSLSLFVSKTREKRWLFWAGIIGLPIHLIVLGLQLWVMQTGTEEAFQIYTNSMPWLIVLLALLLVFYILHFKEELGTLTDTSNATPSKRYMATRMVLSLLSVVAVLIVLRAAASEYSWEKGKVNRASRMVGDFMAKTYINTENDTLKYRLLLPKNYDNTRKYPLVVNLHNGGGVGNDNLIQLDATNTAQLLATDEYREKYPAILFLPQSTTQAGFGGMNRGEGNAKLVFEAMEQLEQVYNIDTNRRYLIGMSVGGYGTWHFMGLHPEKFAAGVPICGGGDPVTAEKMTAIPIWAFHGKRDKAVPVHLTQDMITAIRAAGGTPKYTELSAGHLIWDEVKNTSGLWEWMFAQQKTNSLP
ncbi:hypothetical protein MWU65_01230 [Cellulophaga sp. F20128]|uniref:carboxylesterase family protein n=1 Tax=Cellulophaga sp. F20128 TaxID=2926413 RepID=UPI001FF6819A|nr:hypothetical protein [Cellulophaga sp. F20128]MCK0155782.1 hypothetical protein [Cellulophaga sp. F20128]